MGVKHRHIQVGTNFCPQISWGSPPSPAPPVAQQNGELLVQGLRVLSSPCEDAQRVEGPVGTPRHPFQACTRRPCQVAFVHLESAWARKPSLPHASIPGRILWPRPTPRLRPPGLLLGAVQTGEPRATPPGQWEAAAPGGGAWPDGKGRGRPCPTPTAPDLGPKLGPGFACLRNPRARPRSLAPQFSLSHRS